MINPEKDGRDQPEKDGRQADAISYNPVWSPQGIGGGGLKKQRSEPTRMPSERFHDRQVAGQRLATLLVKRGYDHPIVLGIPRGGMIVAAEVAKVLSAELGVIVSRRLEAPYQPELTIGAVTADDTAYVDAVLAEEVGANRHFLLQEQRRQVEQAQRQQEAIDGARGYLLEERGVLVVTDGLTTGASAIAVTRSLRAAGAARIIVATPVAPSDAIEKLRREADDIACVWEAPEFLSVAQFYDDFQAIDDDAVRDLLQPGAANRFS